LGDRLLLDKKPISGRDAGREALDQLFSEVSQYRNSREYFEMLKFISGLPIYAPYNMFLLYTQNPRLSYVATARQWQTRFCRTVKRGARPLVILAPMSPVLFVYDMLDTEGPDIPDDVLRPFRTLGSIDQRIWENTLLNCGANRIAVYKSPMGTRQAGSAKRINDSYSLSKEELPAPKFEIILKDSFTKEEAYATLVHEIGHILAGHLGPLKERKVPDRSKLGRSKEEMEAESISYIVCQRRNIVTTSAQYLSGYADQNVNLPEFSLDVVLRVAGTIEEWGKKKPKKKKEQ